MGKSGSSERGFHERKRGNYTVKEDNTNFVRSIPRGGTLKYFDQVLQTDLLKLANLSRRKKVITIEDIKTTQLIN